MENMIETPFRVPLVGCAGSYHNQAIGDVGKRLMDAMWSEIKRLGQPTKGINHWVYLPNSELFVGVELQDAGADVGSLERREFVIPRYVKYRHQGPYSALPAVWESLTREFAQQRRTIGHPSMEIYGHWHEDPNQLETTLLVAVA